MAPSQRLEWAAQALAWVSTSNYASDVLFEDALVKSKVDCLLVLAGFQRAPLVQALVLHWGEQAVLLPEPSALQAAWTHQQRMLRLTRLLNAEFAALKRERGWIDMNDVERAAQHMRSDVDISGWVQERLDARVKHLMIDEFQDTSPLQWQALYAWLSGYVGAGSSTGSASNHAPSVFIVGDPKQSIYRFRRAEPQVSLAAQAFVVDGLAGNLLSCDHTRRNATQVIDTVNAVMQSAQTAGEYQDFLDHSTQMKDAG